MGLYSRYIFPRLLEWSLGSAEANEQRRIALAEARGETLEIGFGTGLNLVYYPPGVTKLIALEPEPMLVDLVAQRIVEAPMPVELIQMDASKKMPFEDATFDTIVSTWTLCSIADVDAALREVRRVLRPTGLFIFCEHGRSDRSRTAAIQDLLNPIQRVVGRGCNLNRPMDRIIERADLRIVNLDRFVLSDVPRVFGETYRGIARAASYD